jgi:hypothetical protein
VPTSRALSYPWRTLCFMMLFTGLMTLFAS